MKLSVSYRIIIGVIIAGVIGFFLWRGWNKEAPMVEVKSHPAPDLTLKDYNGRDVKLSDFRGKALLVNSWAAWCPFCKEELPDFVTIKKEFGDKFEVIAIDRAESLEVAKKYSDERGVTDKFIFLLDPGDSFYQAIGGFSMPETIFVDREGMIVFHKRGPMKLEEIRRRVQDNFNL